MNPFTKSIIEDITNEILGQMNSAHYVAVTKNTAPHMLNGSLMALCTLGFIEYDDIADVLHAFMKEYCRDTETYKRIFLKERES